MPSPQPETKVSSSVAPPPIRVLVVDDSAFMRKAISELLASDPEIRVIDTARNGEYALEKVKKLQPDVVTLDIEMPVMNGHEALKRIRKECVVLPEGPPAVLVCSSLTSAGSHDALEAMEAGAADVIAKDASFFSTKMNEMRDELVAKVKAIAGSRRRINRLTRIRAGLPADLPRPVDKDPLPRPVTPRGGFGPMHAQAIAEVPESPAMNLSGRVMRLVAIGSSTGGPPILEQILSQISASLPCPVVIAQHMPVSFTKAMSQRLDGLSPLSVVHGEHGMPLHPGTAYVIPGGKHGRVRAIGRGPLRLEVSDEPRTAPFRPSVSELMASVGEQVGSQGLGVVLTGIGDDGKTGCQVLKNAGGVVIAQDPLTSVVYGMPKAAYEVSGVSMKPENIAKTIGSLAAGAVRAAMAS